MTLGELDGSGAYQRDLDRLKTALIPYIADAGRLDQAAAAILEALLGAPPGCQRVAEGGWTCAAEAEVDRLRGLLGMTPR